MKRAIAGLAFVVMLLLAGCAGEDPEPAGPDNTEPVEGDLFSEPPTQNPWKSSNVSVSITKSVDEGRNYAPFIKKSVKYWNQNMSKLGWEGKFVYRENETDPDVPVHIVDNIRECGNEGDDDTLGCSPVNTRVGSGMEQDAIRIVDKQNDTSTVRISIHEFGHSLGLTHNDTANWTVMNETIASATVEQPNATERANPFENETLLVYYNGTSAEPFDEDVSEELEEVWDYFEAGEISTVTSNVSFERTRNKSKATIEINIVESMNDYASVPKWYGYDPDADGAFETYETATINVSKEVYWDNVAWHVGAQIAYIFSSREEGAQPDELKGETYEERSRWPD